MRRTSAIALAAALLLATLTMSTAALAQSGLRTEGDAVSARGLYQAEVPVNGQGEEERQGGFARALGSVLAKLSGDRSAMSRPGVGAELRNARDYVEGYDYRQDQGTSPTGAPTFRTTLVVRFDEDQVNGLAGALGLPVWPQPRPKPVVWLAINDGSGPRLMGLQHANAARPLLNRAIERGYSLGLPAGGAAEQALVGAIWRQDTAAVARVSSPSRNPSMREVPSASEANMIARCDTDLSPGTVSSPVSGPPCPASQSRRGTLMPAPRRAPAAGGGSLRACPR